MKKIISVILAITLIFTLSATAFAANPVEAPEEWLGDWSSRAESSGKMWQTPGARENDRVFTWLSSDLKNSFTYSDGTDTVTVTPAKKLSFTGIINTVKLNGLKEGSYTYRYTADGKTYDGSFTVSAADSSFIAAFCSDPQLGRSGDNSEKAVQDDTYGWERTLVSAYSNGAELILSAGDQVNEGFSLTQYNAFFSPEIVRTVPIAPTAGNHDFYSPLFPLYFGDAGVNETANDYYFLYKNALFIIIDSNNIVSPVHTATINNAVNAYPDAKWRVVVMHHGAYSSCAEGDIITTLCAGTMKDTFDKYDIDLVLSGHNHFYSRTYPILDGKPSAEGTVYFEAGSASGGKCSHYDTSDTEYIIHSFDLNEASYSLLTFNEDTIEVNSYKTDSGEIFDTFTVVSTEKAQTVAPGIFTLVVYFFERFLSFIPAIF